MNDLLSKVTPLTRGIIWLHRGSPESGTPTYKALDYLLNGLLTSNLTTVGNGGSSLVMVTMNFHFPLHVLLINEFVAAEYESYLKLLKKDLLSENTVLVIDEAEGFTSLLNKTPQDVKSQLYLYK